MNKKRRVFYAMRLEYQAYGEVTAERGGVLRHAVSEVV
jgi:hypothetical protein